jgi:hypothetical protein
MLGEVWNWFVGGHRIGNNHMSYRADRLFYAKHRPELFAAALMIFCLAATNAARRVRLEDFNGRYSYRRKPVLTAFWRTVKS